MDGENSEKVLRAEKIIEAFLDKMERNIDANQELAKSISGIGEMFYDFMGVVMKYGTVVDELIEKYSSKAVNEVGKPSPLLKEIGMILDKIKSLTE